MAALPLRRRRASLSRLARSAGNAKAEWDRMIVRLTAAGTLSSVDAPLLWNYCQLWADGCRLQADADALARTWYEKTCVDGAGVEHANPKLHPVFAALKQYRLALRVYLVEFGLTPLARNRVTAHPAAPHRQRWIRRKRGTSMASPRSKAGAVVGNRRARRTWSGRASRSRFPRVYVADAPSLGIAGWAVLLRSRGRR